MQCPTDAHIALVHSYGYLRMKEKGFFLSVYVFHFFQKATKLFGHEYLINRTVGIAFILGSAVNNMLRY